MIAIYRIVAQIHLPALETLVASYNVLTGLSKDFHGYPVLCYADLEYNSIMTVRDELVDMTQCKLHGVNSTLRIYLEGKNWRTNIIITNITITGNNKR